MQKSELDGCLLIKKETREKLKSIGLKTETYDDIINRLIDSRSSGIDFTSGYELSMRNRDSLGKNSSID